MRGPIDQQPLKIKPIAPLQAKEQSENISA